MLTLEFAGVDPLPVLPQKGERYGFVFTELLQNSNTVKRWDDLITSNIEHPLIIEESSKYRLPFFSDPLPVLPQKGERYGFVFTELLQNSNTVKLWYDLITSNIEHLLIIEEWSKYRLPFFSDPLPVLPQKGERYGFVFTEFLQNSNTVKRWDDLITSNIEHLLIIEESSKYRLPFLRE